MMPQKPKCGWCGRRVKQPWSAINRAAKLGASIYCNREHSSLGRRNGKTEAQKKEEKRLYDIEYRATNLERIIAGRREYFRRTYDPAQAAEYRATRMPYHVEYCRRPDQVAKRLKRDKNRYAMSFGDFAECHTLLMQLTGEVNARASRYEIYKANGLINKTTRRRRDYERTLGRESQRGPLGDLARHQKRYNATSSG